MVNLETNVAGIRLDHPIMNAAGTCRTTKEVERLARSAVSAIVVGAATLKPRQGHPEPTFWIGPDGTSYNCLGLPNGGYDYYRFELGEMVRIAHAAGKPLILSIAGFRPYEFAELAHLAINGVDLLELDLSCPTLSRDRLICEDPALVRDVMHKMKLATRTPVSAKIAPMPRPLLEEVAEILGEFAEAVTATNTLRVKTPLRAGRPVLSQPFCGMGGTRLKPRPGRPARPSTSASPAGQL